MLSELAQALGRSYEIKEVRRNEREAIEALRVELGASAPLRLAAQAELSRLRALIAPYPRGRGREACHVSSVSHDLLAAALQEEPE